MHSLAQDMAICWERTQLTAPLQGSPQAMPFTADIQDLSRRTSTRLGSTPEWVGRSHRHATADSMRSVRPRGRAALRPAGCLLCVAAAAAASWSAALARPCRHATASTAIADMAVPASRTAAASAAAAAAAVAAAPALPPSLGAALLSGEPPSPSLSKARARRSCAKSCIPRQQCSSSHSSFSVSGGGGGGGGG